MLNTNKINYVCGLSPSYNASHLMLSRSLIHQGFRNIYIHNINHTCQFYIKSCRRVPFIDSNTLKTFSFFFYLYIPYTHQTLINDVCITKSHDIYHLILTMMNDVLILYSHISPRIIFLFLPDLIITIIISNKKWIGTFT